MAAKKVVEKAAKKAAPKQDAAPKPAAAKRGVAKKAAAEQGAVKKGPAKQGVPQEGGPEERPAQQAPSPRLKSKYRNDVAPALQKEFDYPGPMAVPKIAMIKLNMGLGEATQNSRLLDSAAVELGAIAGQKPIVTRARKSIAAFKLRQGVPIGCAVTLRGNRMYEFLDRLISIALPRVRDFRGISTKAFDGRGNYTLGLKEHLIFPEIDYSKVDQTKGMNVTIVTTARTDPESLSLLRQMGMPFQD